MNQAAHAAPTALGRAARRTRPPSGSSELTCARTADSTPSAPIGTKPSPRTIATSFRHWLVEERLASATNNGTTTASQRQAPRSQCGAPGPPQGTLVGVLTVPCLPFSRILAHFRALL